MQQDLHGYVVVILISGILVGCSDPFGPDSESTEYTKTISPTNGSITLSEATLYNDNTGEELGTGITDLTRQKETLLIIRAEADGFNSATKSIMFKDTSDVDITLKRQNTEPLDNQIVFVSYSNGDGGIFVMNADGNEQIQLTQSSLGAVSPIISPEGSKIVFKGKGGNNRRLFVINADGSGITQLADNVYEYIEPVLSPDGSMIVYLGSKPNECCFYFKINIDGSGLLQLTGDVSPASNPTFSPDGSKIVFEDSDGNDREIYSINADGTGKTQLTDNSADDLSPTFSPDGDKIAYQVKPNNRYDDEEIYLMNADGSGQTNLTDNEWFYERNPIFSPDGNKIAYTGLEKIYIMNADGSNQKVLTKEPGKHRNPVFSPDGSKIAFERTYDDENKQDIFVVNTDGSGSIINLTNNPSSTAGEPDWGPKK